MSVNNPPDGLYLTKAEARAYRALVREAAERAVRMRSPETAPDTMYGTVSREVPDWDDEEDAA